MTQVVARILTSTVFEWIVPTERFGYAVYGDIQDAVAMAANQYKAVTGKSFRGDDWLKVSVRDGHIVFWFEFREEQS